MLMKSTTPAAARHDFRSKPCHARPHHKTSNNASQAKARHKNVDTNGSRLLSGPADTISRVPAPMLRILIPIFSPTEPKHNSSHGVLVAEKVL